MMRSSRFSGFVRLFLVALIAVCATAAVKPRVDIPAGDDTFVWVETNTANTAIKVRVRSRVKGTRSVVKVFTSGSQSQVLQGTALVIGPDLYGGATKEFMGVTPAMVGYIRVEFPSGEIRETKRP